MTKFLCHDNESYDEMLPKIRRSQWGFCARKLRTKNLLWIFLNTARSEFQGPAWNFSDFSHGKVRKEEKIYTKRLCLGAGCNRTEFYSRHILKVTTLLLHLSSARQYMCKVGRRDDETIEHSEIIETSSLFLTSNNAAYIVDFYVDFNPSLIMLSCNRSNNNNKNSKLATS